MCVIVNAYMCVYVRVGIFVFHYVTKYQLLVLLYNREILLYYVITNKALCIDSYALCSNAPYM